MLLEYFRVKWSIRWSRTLYAFLFQTVHIRSVLEYLMVLYTATSVVNVPLQTAVFMMRCHRGITMFTSIQIHVTLSWRLQQKITDLLSHYSILTGVSNNFYSSYVSEWLVLTFWPNFNENFSLKKYIWNIQNMTITAVLLT